MDQKAGCGVGLDDDALKDLLKRLHDLGYREARRIEDPAQLGTMQYLRWPDLFVDSASGVRYWKVIWRQL